VGDWSPEGRLGTIDTDEEPSVSLEEARALFLTHGAVFIDARPPETFEDGHIAGALNIFPETFDQSSAQMLTAVPPDSLVITYCDGETCNLSKDLATLLAARGYSHVRVLVNGWSRWQEAGLPTETGSGKAAG
jgi:rhodanese-related sulfurtransferase